ncbi:DUF2155 domain-containing protein [uncultured Lentibacter sp.]|uniref:DUF2155 domain-containing protein n=1 Tax=uncultured Lentibacter sp. TaxID=1659309 RepID=UPI00261FB433|nr:DUF2155 domain-containing protein [uncultured Lentibacter sp.]MCW1955181.1 DUF2155 domain-containing protein [Roseobacter sp.]
MRPGLAGLVLLMAGTAATGEEVSLGTGAILRGLDKVNGKTTDLDMENGSSLSFGRLVVSLGECRYPEGNPSGDAYAFVTIRETGKADLVFSGWMVASSPALSALDHARYDVWVTRCKTQ